MPRRNGTSLGGPGGRGGRAFLVLEQSQAAVDMFGHRLVHVERLDLN